ncbi:MAG TPA: META domain-containing protein [Gemmatimonadaceae bacterium]|jgi:Heat shock protein
MSSRVITRLTACAAAFLLLACAKAPGDRASDTAASRSGGASSAAIVEREWALVTLGDSAAPQGSGGKPATIRFDSAASRAAGFAGCNRYSAPYTIAGDSLGFGPAISTKMACAEGDSLERAYLAIIPDVTGYQATDSTLTLTGSSGALAVFRAQ